MSVDSDGCGEKGFYLCKAASDLYFWMLKSPAMEVVRLVNK